MTVKHKVRHITIGDFFTYLNTHIKTRYLILQIVMLWTLMLKVSLNNQFNYTKIITNTRILSIKFLGHSIESIIFLSSCAKEIFNINHTMQLITCTKGIRLVWNLQVNSTIVINFLLSMMFLVLNYPKNTWSQDQPRTNWEFIWSSIQVNEDLKMQ